MKSRDHPFTLTSAALTLVSVALTNHLLDTNLESRELIHQIHKLVSDIQLRRMAECAEFTFISAIAALHELPQLTTMDPDIIGDFIRVRMNELDPIMASMITNKMVLSIKALQPLSRDTQKVYFKRVYEKELILIPLTKLLIRAKALRQSIFAIEVEQGLKSSALRATIKALEDSQNQIQKLEESYLAMKTVSPNAAVELNVTIKSCRYALGVVHNKLEIAISS